MADDFRPALIVIDVQEDFCPPHGALAVPGGRDIIGHINELLELPSFVVRVATKDWHPADHMSFAANHVGKQPFTDMAEMVNPENAAERQMTRLWPVHCVQGTSGAELASELNAERLDEVVLKGTDPRYEMYGPFYGPFATTSTTASSSPSPSPSPSLPPARRVGDSGLVALLRGHGVTDVYVVGLAGDYCVRRCAEDAAKEGFRTYLIEECTRPVDAGDWPQCKRQIQEGSGASIINMDDPQVLRLKIAT